jgi:7-cyano-7-deazaguanine reductase
MMQDQERVSGRYGLDEIERSKLESWPNPCPQRNYVVHLEIPEFTCLCPQFGLPDFATIVLDYVPDIFIVELKSLKLYINTYRNRQIGHEASVNKILDDLIALLDPRWIRVIGNFTVRGNIKTVLFAEQEQAGYTGPRPHYHHNLPANG